MATYLARTHVATPEDIASIVGWLLETRDTFEKLLAEAHAERAYEIERHGENARSCDIDLPIEACEGLVANLAVAAETLGYERIEGATDEAA